MSTGNDNRPAWLKTHGICDCIACHDYKADLHVPVLLSKRRGLYRYQCPDCQRLYVNREPCMMHMGKISNIPGTCPGVETEAYKRKRQF